MRPQFTHSAQSAKCRFTSAQGVCFVVVAPHAGAYAGDTPSVKRTLVWGYDYGSDYGHNRGNYGTPATQHTGGHRGARPCVFISI